MLLLFLHKCCCCCCCFNCNVVVVFYSNLLLFHIQIVIAVTLSFVVTVSKLECYCCFTLNYCRSFKNWVLLLFFSYMVLWPIYKCCSIRINWCRILMFMSGDVPKWMFIRVTITNWEVCNGCDSV